MAKEIFRRVALERLTSPERLEQTTRIIGSANWLALVAIATAIVIGIVWSAVAFAPVRVEGAGIFIQPAGVRVITAEHGGRIESLAVSSGDSVNKGQIVARIARPDLRQELATARRELADYQQRLDRVVTFHEENRERERAVRQRRLARITDLIAQLEERAALLEQQVAGIQGLIENGTATKDRLIDAKVQLTSARSRISTLQEEREQLQLEAETKAIERARERLDLELERDALQRQVGTLKARLAKRAVVKSPYAGRVIEMQSNAGDVVASGAEIMTLLPTEGGEAGELIALLYVPADSGKKVQPGMAAQIVPTSVKPQAYGYIKGEVISIASLPASREGMQRILQNQDLVRRLSREGAPFEARIKLERAPDSASGFRWTSSQGPDLTFNAGNLVRGRVTVERERIISLAVPQIEKIL